MMLAKHEKHETLSTYCINSNMETPKKEYHRKNFVVRIHGRPNF